MLRRYGLRAPTDQLGDLAIAPVWVALEQRFDQLALLQRGQMAAGSLIYQATMRT
jgi:hypothetical protein